MSHLTAKFVFRNDTVYEVDLPAGGAVPQPACDASLRTTFRRSWSIFTIFSISPQLVQMILRCACAGKLSDSIAEFRKQSGVFLTTFLASHNQSTEEVDIMEEVVDEDGVAHGADAKSKQGRRRGGKRKR